MIDNKRLLSLVDLMTRARKAVSGESSMEKSVRSGKPHLVIVSGETSDNAGREFTNIYTHYEVPIYLFGTKDELGHTTGQEFKTSLSVEGTDFARSMVERVNINGGNLNESK